MRACALRCVRFALTAKAAQKSFLAKCAREIRLRTQAPPRRLKSLNVALFLVPTIDRDQRGFSRRAPRPFLPPGGKLDGNEVILGIKIILARFIRYANHSSPNRFSCWKKNQYRFDPFNNHGSSHSISLIDFQRKDNIR